MTAATPVMVAIVAWLVGAGVAVAEPPALSREESQTLPPAEVIRRALAALADGAMVAPAPPYQAGLPLNSITVWTRPHATTFPNLCERADVAISFATHSGASAKTSLPVSGMATTHSYLLLGRTPWPRFFIGDPFDRKSPDLEAACAQLAPNDPRFFLADSPRNASIDAEVFHEAIDAAKANAPGARGCEKQLQGCVAILAALDPNRIDSVAGAFADGRRGVVFRYDIQAGGRSWRLGADAEWKIKEIGLTPVITIME